MKDYKSIFSANVRHCMDSNGLSNRAVADKIGVSYSTLQDWKTGSSPQNYFAVKKFCVMFGVQFEDIFFQDLTNQSVSMENAS